MGDSSKNLISVHDELTPKFLPLIPMPQVPPMGDAPCPKMTTEAPIHSTVVPEVDTTNAIEGDPTLDQVVHNNTAEVAQDSDDDHDDTDSDSSNGEYPVVHADADSEDAEFEVVFPPSHSPGPILIKVVTNDIETIKNVWKETDGSTTLDTKEGFTQVISKKSKKTLVKLSRAAGTHNTCSRGPIPSSSQ